MTRAVISFVLLVASLLGPMHSAWAETESGNGTTVAAVISERDGAVTPQGTAATGTTHCPHHCTPFSSGVPGTVVRIEKLSSFTVLNADYDGTPLVRALAPPEQPPRS